jgi:hypothetical protein
MTTLGFSTTAKPVTTLKTRIHRLSVGRILLNFFLTRPLLIGATIGQDT